MFPQSQLYVAFSAENSGVQLGSYVVSGFLRRLDSNPVSLDLVLYVQDVLGKKWLQKGEWVEKEVQVRKEEAWEYAHYFHGCLYKEINLVDSKVRLLSLLTSRTKTGTNNVHNYVNNNVVRIK